jgi:hypothetical protein
MLVLSTFSAIKWKLDGCTGSLSLMASKMPTVNPQIAPLIRVDAAKTPRSFATKCVWCHNSAKFVHLPDSGLSQTTLA